MTTDRSRGISSWIMVLIAIPLVYVLSSGPALLCAGKPIWYRLRLSTFYRPLSWTVAYTPAYRVLLPYWGIWHDDRDTNPLIPG